MLRCHCMHSSLGTWNIQIIQYWLVTVILRLTVHTIPKKPTKQGSHKHSLNISSSKSPHLSSWLSWLERPLLEKWFVMFSLSSWQSGKYLRFISKSTAMIIDRNRFLLLTGNNLEEEKKGFNPIHYTIFSFSKEPVYAMQRHTRRWSTDPVLW